MTITIYNSDNQLVIVNSTTNLMQYSYDIYGRLSTEKKTVIGNKSLLKSYTYANGNIASVQYSTQDGTVGTENYTYTNGYLSEIKLGTTSIWKLKLLNAAGQPKEVEDKNHTRFYRYDTYGFPTERSYGSLFNLEYQFNPTTGNLTYRTDGHPRKIRENFTYDALNRLETYAEGNVEYDPQGKGNIIKRSEIGNTFFYNTPNKPYAISGVDATANVIPFSNQTVTYTSFHRPATISENGYTADFTYDGKGDRIKMELKKDNAKELTRYYLMDRYEIDDRNVGGLKEKLYLGGDYYTAPAVYVKDGSKGWQLYFLFRDHLGSIAYVTNGMGLSEQKMCYDPWGRLRNPTTRAVYAPGSEPELFLGRGYTGHEHLPWFGLINMNARLYDPAVGRFLSLDPYIQMPDFTQNFNRYSYALNNPLK